MGIEVIEVQVAGPAGPAGAPGAAGASGNPVNFPSILVGEWRPSYGVGSTNNTTTINNRGLITPIWLDAATYDQINIFVGAAGDGASAVRLGLMNQNGDVLGDAGTVTALSTGTKIATFPTPIVIAQSGWFYCIAVVQGASVTTPNLARHQSGQGGGLMGPIGNGNSLTNQPASGFLLAATISGVLPSNLSMVGRAMNTSPIFTIRRSA